jgi:uncharacterized membrane protein YgcG
MASLHPTLAAEAGVMAPIVAFAACFQSPGEDNTMDIVIPLRIRLQRRVARNLGKGLKLPNEDPAGLSDRARFWAGLSEFYADVLRFAAVRTLSPSVGKLSGDDDQILAVLQWAETKRQADADLETYREKYLTQRGSSSVLEEIKKAFDNDFTYSSFACDIYKLLCNEESMATVLQHLTLAPSQGDQDADRFAFESMLTTLFNKKFISLTDVGDTGMTETDWRARHKGPFYQALRRGLTDLFQNQPEQLLAGRVSETGGAAVLLGEEMDIATMQMVLDDPIITRALAFAEQSISCIDSGKKASLRDECWQTLFADHLRPANVRRFLLEMHKLAIKAGSSLQITTSTTSSSTTSSTLDLDGAGAAFAKELANMLSTESSQMKGKFKGAIFTLIKCLGAFLDKLILIEPVESSRARPVVLIQGPSTVIQLRQTCLGISDDFVITSLHLFTNIKAAADINFDKINTIPDDATYKKVMKSVSACLESTLHSIVSWDGVPETFAKTMKQFILDADHNDDWHCYRVVLQNGKVITGLRAFHGTSTDGHADQHGVIASIIAKWRERYFNRLMGIDGLKGDFAPLQQYLVMDQLATLAPDIHAMLTDARRTAKQDRIKGISKEQGHLYSDDDADADDDDHGGRGGSGGRRGRGGRGGKGGRGKGGKDKGGKGGKGSPKKQIQFVSGRGLDTKGKPYEDIIQETLYQGTVRDEPFDAVKSYDVILSIWGNYRHRYVKHFKSSDADCMLHRLTGQCPGGCRYLHEVTEISDEEVKRFLRQPRIQKLMPTHLIAMMAPEFAAVMDPDGKAKLSERNSKIAKRIRKSKKE